VAEASPAPSFHPSARNDHARGLFAGLPADYDRWATILSLGQDPRWRDALCDRLPVARTGHVLDVASGTGAVAIAVARRNGCRVTGVDQSAEMLAVGRRRVTEVALDEHVTLVEANAEALPFADASFDGLSGAYLLRYVDDPAAVVRELLRPLRPGAPFAYFDFAVPPSPPARAAWELYTRVGLPLAGRLIAPAWHEVGRFLNGSIRRFAATHPPEAVAGLFAAAGGVDVGCRRLSLGGAALVFGWRGPA
jgi:demethylmenaquinone methyltransferase/2-methoxy-6-polyprenyl-1,4-benzoquinol methylase